MQLRCLGLPLTSLSLPKIYVFSTLSGCIWCGGEGRPLELDLRWDPSSTTLAAVQERDQNRSMKSYTDTHTLNVKLQLSYNAFF